MKPKLDLKKFASFFWGVATEKEKDHVYKSQESDSMLKQDWNSASNDIKITSKQEKEELLKNIYRSKTKKQSSVRNPLTLSSWIGRCRGE